MADQFKLIAAKHQQTIKLIGNAVTASLHLVALDELRVLQNELRREAAAPLGLAGRGREEDGRRRRRRGRRGWGAHALG